MNIPITIIIGLLGVLVGAWFQRRHWLRSVAEEVRVRETKDASELIDLISLTFDKRISVQRSFLHAIGDPDREAELDEYRDAIKEYGEKINTIRSKTLFYFSYSDVVSYEEELHERLVSNGVKIMRLRSRLSSSERVDIVRERADLDRELSIVSAKVFRECQSLYSKVANRDFGSLRKIHDWRDPENDYVSSIHLMRKVLNI